MAVGSGANFNATSANPGTLITAGTLVVTDSHAGQAILSMSAVKPGTTTTGSVDIENGGSIPATFTLASTNLVNTPATPPLSGKLTLQIQDLGDPSCTVSCPAARTVYSGALGSMGTLPLGRDPETSVVDPEGRHHRVPNVYVVDGSLFPTSLGGPPQITIYTAGRKVARSVIADLRRAT